MEGLVVGFFILRRLMVARKGLFVLFVLCLSVVSISFRFRLFDVVEDQCCTTSPAQEDSSDSVVFPQSPISITDLD